MLNYGRLNVQCLFFENSLLWTCVYSALWYDTASYPFDGIQHLTLVNPLVTHPSRYNEQFTPLQNETILQSLPKDGRFAIEVPRICGRYLLETKSAWHVWCVGQMSAIASSHRPPTEISHWRRTATRRLYPTDLCQGPDPADANYYTTLAITLRQVKFTCSALNSRIYAHCSMFHGSTLT